MTEDMRRQGHGNTQTLAGKDNASPIKVHVHKVSQTGQKVECQILPDAGYEHYVSNNEINLTENGGPFRIEFRLEDPLEWDGADPMNTSQAGCPGKHTNDDQQIFLQSPNGKFLTILNLNGGDPCTIHYRMNFLDGSYCDPIMNNGGTSIFR
jgi:hypothetical protein